MATTSARLRREHNFIARNYPRRYPTMIETTVRSGFPVIALGVANPAEPEVGIFSAYMDDVIVVTRDWRYADFLKLTKAELTTIEQSLMAAANARD